MEVLNVLVVDDEPGIRSGVSRILSKFVVGYPFMDEDIKFEVFEASSGEEAIEIINKQNIDISLLDNKLPGMDGIEVLEYINKNQLGIEVMMITSYASLELAVKATNIGAYDFVPKPFTPQELRSSMENITKHLFLKRMTQNLQREGRHIRFQFLSMLSHELKTPLNTIEGYLRMMQERQAGDDIGNYDKMISRSISRVKAMRGLILDLLDLTKIESGKKKREIVELDLVSVLQSAIDAMSPLAIQKDVKIHIENEDSVYFYADNEEFEIIFNNLISNAVKYNKEHGEVFCKIVPGDAEIGMIVRDTGIGISAEEIPNLFKEFMRVKNEKTRKISGSGLGLSIVKKILELYEGDIKVISEIGKGSEFCIKLPIKK